jgi:hypothetical protein
MRPFLLSVGCMLRLVILTAESGPLDRPLRDRFSRGHLGQCSARTWQSARGAAACSAIRRHGPADRRRLPAQVPAGTVMDALNAIVAAHGDAFWRVRYPFWRVRYLPRAEAGFVELAGFASGSVGAS